MAYIQRSNGRLAGSTKGGAGGKTRGVKVSTRRTKRRTVNAQNQFILEHLLKGGMHPEPKSFAKMYVKGHKPVFSDADGQKLNRKGKKVK